MLDLESIFTLFGKSSLKFSFLLGERVPSLRDLLLCPWRRLWLSRWLGLLLSLGRGLVESLLLFGKVRKLLLQLRQLLSFLLCSPFPVILLTQRWPELASRSTQR
jgi:hypothetical protein